MHSRSSAVFGGATVAALLMAACDAPPPEPSPQDIRDARQAAMTLDSRLHREILSRLETDGETATYLGYRRIVPEMTAAIGEEMGVELKRTAFRVRNRANAADDWEVEKLEALEFSIEAGLNPQLLEFSEVVEEDDGSRVFRWIRPIVMSEGCLACHGDLVSTEVLDMLALEYPDDEATGYLEFELGGAYSVRRPIPE